MYFHADVIRRERQKILAIRDHHSSFTSAAFIPSEQATDIRDELIRLVTPLRYAKQVTVKGDNAKAFQSLQNGDPYLDKLLIKVTTTEVMNKNENAVIDQGNS